MLRILCWTRVGVSSYVSPGVLGPCVSSGVAASCVGSARCSAGAPWERGGGALAALGFHSNSREEPGNTSSGRKAAAVRREPRASLAEQAPDTLSV